LLFSYKFAECKIENFHIFDCNFRELRGPSISIGVVDCNIEAHTKFKIELLNM